MWYLCSISAKLLLFCGERKLIDRVCSRHLANCPNVCLLELDILANVCKLRLATLATFDAQIGNHLRGRWFEQQWCYNAWMQWGGGHDTFSGWMLSVTPLSKCLAEHPWQILYILRVKVSSDLLLCNSLLDLLTNRPPDSSDRQSHILYFSIQHWSPPGMCAQPPPIYTVWHEYNRTGVMECLI